MTPEQKQRIAHEISNWRGYDLQESETVTESELAGMCSKMAALLQELVDAPEPEPFGYFKAEPFGWTDCAETDDGSIALYTAPPAPSVPDGWKHDCAGIMQNDVELWLDSCPHCGKPKTYAAPTPAEAPADVARDAWYGSNPPSLFQATAIYMALLEAAQNPKKLSDERILELFYENATPDRWPFGFASAIEREIFGENK